MNQNQKIFSFGCGIVVGNLLSHHFAGILIKSFCVFVESTNDWQLGMLFASHSEFGYDFLLTTFGRLRIETASNVNESKCGCPDCLFARSSCHTDHK